MKLHWPLNLYKIKLFCQCLHVVLGDGVHKVSLIALLPRTFLIKIVFACFLFPFFCFCKNIQWIIKQTTPYNNNNNFVFCCVFIKRSKKAISKDADKHPCWGQRSCCHCRAKTSAGLQLDVWVYWKNKSMSWITNSSWQWGGGEQRAPGSSSTEGKKTHSVLCSVATFLPRTSDISSNVQHRMCQCVAMFDCEGPSACLDRQTDRQAKDRERKREREEGGRCLRRRVRTKVTSSSIYSSL